MSKNNDRYRQRRLGDSRWVQKYAIGQLNFEDDDSQLESKPQLATGDAAKRWAGIQFVSFGSGSSGNCSFLGNENEGVLIDAGVDPDHVYRDLEANGINIRRVKGILLTHDHADHIRYAYRIVRENKHMRIYCTPRLMGGMLRHHNVSRRIKDYQVSIFKEIPFFLAGMKFTAFETSHDAIDNMGFSINIGDKTFVVATDMGLITPRAEHYMVRGEKGHLDNEVAAQFVASHYHDGLDWVFLCHLSNDNNTPAIACKAMTQALEARGLTVGDGSNAPGEQDKDVQVYALPRYDSSLWFVL